MSSLSREPLFLQVRDRILEMIQRQDYNVGDQIPSEKQLTGEFGVSRATVREALKVLEEERILICRHGVGRFVAPGTSDVLREGITSLRSVTDMAKELSIPLTTKVLSVSEELPEDAVREHLNLPPGVTVVALERVRMAYDQPVIYLIDIFPRSLMSA